MNKEQPYIKYHENLELLLKEDLDYGIEYVQVNKTLSPKQLKEDKLYIHYIRGKYKFETDEEYMTYKSVIKKWCDEGLLYKPSTPMKDVKNKKKR